MTEVVDVPAEQHFVLSVDGDPVGRLDYAVDGDVVVALHVGVDPAHEGQGLGTTLVREALDQVRASGRRVRPRCPFVVHFLREHPEYADLLEVA